MKLFFHPVSTASRPVMQFCVDAGIEYEPVVVDLTTGEHLRPPYSKINPNCLVPTLQDGDFTMTESSAILKYLADKVGSQAYPKDLKQRARVNELMDWFNTQFYREYGYHMVYPQIFAHHKRQTDEINKATAEWGRDKARASLKILNDNVLGDGRKFLTGDKVTIADYFGAGILTLGETIGVDISSYPNVSRWIANMKAMPSWARTNEIFNGFVGSLKGKPYITIN